MTENEVSLHRAFCCAFNSLIKKLSVLDQVTKGVLGMAGMNLVIILMGFSQKFPS